MFRAEGRIVISASDVVFGAGCDYASARRIDEVLGRVRRVAPPPDPMFERTLALGQEHEDRVLERLLERLGTWEPGRTGGVAVLPDRASTEPAELAALEDVTRAALDGGAAVVHQASFFDGEFSGRADFVLRGDVLDPDGDPERWTVADAKLARSAKSSALLQLGAYAEQLRRLGHPLAERGFLMLGTGEEPAFGLRSLMAIHRERRADLLARIAERERSAGPLTWGDPGAEPCGRCEVCEAEITAHDDLLRVAGMRMDRRAALRAAGITTMTQLAEMPAPQEGRLAALWRQARLQTGIDPGEEPTAEPGFRVVHRDALALPAPSPGDVFFDFEGDPLFIDEAGGWGLEYLFGLLTIDTGAQVFQPIWAHSRAEERAALLRFLDLIEERLSRWPDLHVYHYAPYEATALKQLASRHGVGEDRVDALLRAGTLVDLYPVVRQSLQVGQDSYSIKKLEPLYMVGPGRTQSVAKGDDSIAAYGDYTSTREAAEAARAGGAPAGEVEAAQAAAEARLAEIGAYNEYDCLSTLFLRDWLRGLATRHAVASRAGEVPETAERRREGLSEQAQEAQDRRDLVSEQLEDAAGEAPRTPERQAIAMAAAGVEYYRREEKPQWWAHFERLQTPVEDLSEHRDVFVVTAGSCAVVEDWHRTPRGRVDKRHVELRGSWGLGSTIRPGSSGFALHEPAREGMSSSPSAPRGWVAVTVLETEGDRVVIEQRRLPDGSEPGEPLALTPGGPVPTQGQREAVLRWAEALAASLPSLPRDPVADLLIRREPRIPGGLPAAGDDLIAAIVTALRAMDDSYIAVQGPPGTGKSYTGSRVIVQLAGLGWRIGVVAQSHSVVENLLRGVVRAGAPAGSVGRKLAQQAPPRPDDPIVGLSTTADFSAFLGTAGRIIGGTAWDFSSPSKVGDAELDLLVIDEAGQFSLANTIAVARSARRLLLLGDPQQLPQVSQGIHPEPVDDSALGWLSHGHDTLPSELGYFLADSWRMHPALCQKVSELSYEGRLRSAPAAAERGLVGIDPGVHTVMVEHSDNAVRSAEEAVEIAARISDLLGTAWNPGDGPVRPLGQSDVLVVAAYNTQVVEISQALVEAGLPEVPVGTVDRFQGREAAVVFASMAASAPEDAPRGLDFLLSRHRINVAVSRAQWAAWVVRSPRLTRALPASPGALDDLGAFIALCEGTTAD